jgi:hypothetical protein
MLAFAEVPTQAESWISCRRAHTHRLHILAMGSGSVFGQGLDIADHTRT